jgi:hypothetical protein
VPTAYTPGWLGAANLQRSCVRGERSTGAGPRSDGRTLCPGRVLSLARVPTPWGDRAEEVGAVLGSMPDPLRVVNRQIGFVPCFFMFLGRVRRSGGEGPGAMEVTWASTGNCDLRSPPRRHQTYSTDFICHRGNVRNGGFTRRLGIEAPEWPCSR